MTMRSTMTGLFGAAVIAISSLGLVGCSEATSPAADMPESLMNVTIPSPAMDEGIFYEGSLDEPMAVERPGTDMKRVPFGDLLRALELSPRQQEAVKGLLAAHEDCMKAAMAGLRESERAILAPFNEKRNAIREAVKSGEMTREEARTALAEINKSAREALRANADARKAAAEAAKKCREDFINALRGMLTPKQTLVLKRWLAAQNGPKGGGRDTTNVGPGKGGPRGGGDTGGGNTGGGNTGGGRRP